MRRIAALAGLAGLAATGVVVGLTGNSAAPAPLQAAPAPVRTVTASPVALASQLPASSSAAVARSSAAAAAATYTRLVVRTTVIPFGVFRHNDPTLYVGTTKVTQVGRRGVLRTVYRITARNHRQIAVKFVRHTVTVTARAQLVAVGTKPRPVPKPKPVSHPAPAGHYPGVPTYVQQLNWAALARCESGGNPRSTDGIYYGLYQFSIGAWRSVGGAGLPTSATAYEQTYRAMLLYMRSGASPWPTCGRYL